MYLHHQIVQSLRKFVLHFNLLEKSLNNNINNLQNIYDEKCKEFKLETAKYITGFKINHILIKFY